MQLKLKTLRFHPAHGANSRGGDGTLSFTLSLQLQQGKIGQPGANALTE